MAILRHTIFLFLFLAIVSGFGQDLQKLEKSIDSIVSNAIKKKAFPGCVIYASAGDSVIYQKSFGFHTYDSSRRVALNDLYDLASVTKIAGGTLAMMSLYDNGCYDLDDPIGEYIDGLGSKVGKVTFREAMAHQGGLYPWIPYHQEIRKRDGAFKGKFISPAQKEGFDFELADRLYLNNDFYDHIKRMIKKSKVSKTKSYKYSGLFFYLIPELVEKLTGKRYDQYLSENFYEPLGAKSVTFNPTEKFDLAQLVPTEMDTFFRMHQIHGYVHDEGAIMMKGISANAGLFGNAEDVAKLTQLWVNQGTHDSLTLLKPQTIELFTTAQYPNNGNRRGLGFDKPLLEYDPQLSSVAKSASFRSYGHTGYTGTLVWVDPENKLTYVFLANRVYPTRENKMIYQLNVRPSIHQLFYDYLEGK